MKFYHKELKDVKKELEKVIETKTSELNALEWLDKTLKEFKPKDLSKRLKTFITTKSPILEREVMKWNTKTRKKEPYMQKIEKYSIYIEKSFSTNITLYSYKSNKWDRTQDTVYLRSKYGEKTEKTEIELLKEVIKESIKYKQQYIKELKTGKGKLTSIFNKYVKLNKDLNAFEESQSYTILSLIKN